MQFAAHQLPHQELCARAFKAINVYTTGSGFPGEVSTGTNKQTTPRLNTATIIVEVTTTSDTEGNLAQLDENKKGRSPSTGDIFKTLLVGTDAFTDVQSESLGSGHKQMIITIFLSTEAIVCFSVMSCPRHMFIIAVGLFTLEERKT